MPNRYLREGILRSRRVNALSWQGEVFYRRLLSVVDDFGRFDADPPLLRAYLFPMQVDKVSASDAARLLDECEEKGLLVTYMHGVNRYLALDSWERGRASRSKYPDPPLEVASKLHGKDIIASGRKFDPREGGWQDGGSCPQLGGNWGQLRTTPTPTPTPGGTRAREGESVGDPPPENPPHLATQEKKKIREKPRLFIRELQAIIAQCDKDIAAVKMRGREDNGRLVLSAADQSLLGEYRAAKARAERQLREAAG